MKGLHLPHEAGRAREKHLFVEQELVNCRASRCAVQGYLANKKRLPPLWTPTRP